MTSTLLDDAERALDLVGDDPRAALALADDISTRAPRPRTGTEIRAYTMAQRAAALALRTIGTPADGEPRLRQAIRIATRGREPQVAAEARMTLSFVLMDLGRFRKALATTERAIADLSGVEQARVRTIQALVLHRLGRIDDAFATYDVALASLQEAGDELWESRLRSNRSLLELELGLAAEALSDLEWTRSHDLAQGRTIDAADALFNIGIVLYHWGDIPGALERFDRAEAEWTNLSRPELWAARADAYLKAGLVDDAIANARAFLEFASERRWTALVAQAHMQLSACLLSASPPDLGAAAAQARAARRMLVRQGRLEAVAQADYVIATARMLTGPTPRGFDDVSDVIERLSGYGAEARAADLRLAAGRAALASGRLEDARALLGPLATRTGAGLLEVRSRAWVSRALIAEANGERRAAARQLRSAWAVVERQRSLLGATELRASSASHALSIVSSGLRLAVASRSPTQAFSWAERGRATALRHRPATAPRDPELAAALARLRYDVMTRESAGLAGAAPGPVRPTSEAEVLRITRRVGASGPAAAPTTLDGVRRLLHDERFVHLLSDQGRTWAVVVDARRARLVDLGPTVALEADVGAVAFGLRRLLTGFSGPRGAEATMAATQSALDRLDSVLRPALGTADDGNLVVSPTTSLSALPWAALASSRGRVVSVAPSATAWSKARAGRTDAVPRLVAVAGPGLPGAEQEVVELAALHPTSRVTVRTGADATVAGVLAGTVDADVLHLAAHGRLRTDNPLFSSIELYDGPLTGYDLETAPAAPSTVVLSACSSGAGHATVGEETLGLAWTLMSMGTAAVIGPLLPVPDDQTRRLMVELHRGLARGLRPPKALARARAGVDDRDPVATAVAAAFVVYGA